MKVIIVILSFVLAFIMLYYIVRILFNYIRHSQEIEINHPYAVKLFFISIIQLILQIIQCFIS